MKTALKSLALRGLTVAPVYAGLRLRALRDRPVTILCYHTLRPDDQTFDAWVALRQGDFVDQLALLRTNYDIVSLDDALLPDVAGARPRVVLTFDDGELGLSTHLLPIIKAQDIPVTVYVATAHIETGQPFWFDRVMNALQGAGRTEIRLKGLGTWQIGPARGKARWAQIGPVLEAIKGAPTMARDDLADKVAAQAGAMAQGFTPLQPMTRTQLEELAQDPRVTIGAHTHEHELLDQMPVDRAIASITRSRELLAGWTGQDIRHFAYPNGNYTPQLMEALTKLGFVSSTILGDRLMRRDAQAQALPRIAVGRYDALSRLKLRLIEV